MDLVAWLIERGADPSAGCDLDETPLSCAVAYHSVDMVKYLISHASTLQKGDLVYCAMSRKPPDLEVIKLLVEAGAPLDEIPHQDGESFRHRGGFTLGAPLGRACTMGEVEIARYPLAHGADPDKMSRCQLEEVHPTPREIAQERGNEEMMVLFHEKATSDSCQRLERDHGGLLIEFERSLTAEPFNQCLIISSYIRLCNALGLDAKDVRDFENKNASGARSSAQAKVSRHMLSS